MTTPTNDTSHRDSDRDPDRDSEYAARRQRSGDDDWSSLGDPAQRGRLVVAEKVIEKIASQAASEVSVSAGRSGGILGIGAHTDTTARPKVTVELSGRTATIEVETGVVYPTPLKQATGRIRDHIISRVQELTGVDVRRVDITIAWLSTGTEPNEPRRLQ
ncbi:MAG: Asp23/Gls24 family envelope stress response protein [Propionibacteriaceae bacterium]|nr:Asp23/Gls24 family envelope stress response protein [Propionibacteriaceae bacterium]